jgi:7-carboxy-7-deazaguanine synthase
MSLRGLLVSEVFGPTLQGEGRSTGKLCAFVRLGGCNLHCNWCDTPYTWAFDTRHASLHVSGKQYDPKVELRRMSPVSVAEDIYKRLPNGGLVVISGGEPMLQAEEVSHLIKALDVAAGFADVSYDIEIETAGTIRPRRDLIQYGVSFNVSPKLSHSGNERSVAYQPSVLRVYAADERTMFKFVCKSEADLDEVQHWYVDELNLDPRTIYIMPEGITPEAVLEGGRNLVDQVVARGWNFTTRLHTLLWGDERGR